MKDDSITASELLRQLNSDPAWRKKKELREAKREQFRQQLREEQEPLLEDLRRASIDISNVWDLVNSTGYTNALPILVDHLKRNYHPRIREGIARALGEAEAKKFLPQILEAFERESNTEVNGPKWALGNTIDILADESYCRVIADLALDKKHGAARTMLIHALARWENVSITAKDALDRLREDELMGKHVEAARSKRLKNGSIA